MDITEYFKQFEAKWWQEESEVFIDDEVLEELGPTFKVDQKSLKAETAQLEETNDSAKPMQEAIGKSLPTLQIIFRCLAECESYNFQTLDEIRLYAQQPYMMEKEYKEMLQSMWNKYASSKQTMNAIEMSKMLTFILKKELKEGEKILDTIGKAKARLEMGVKKACTREINHAKSRSSNSKFVEQQFTEQKDATCQMVAILMITNANAPHRRVKGCDETNLGGGGLKPPQTPHRTTTTPSASLIHCKTCAISFDSTLQE